MRASTAPLAGGEPEVGDVLVVGRGVRIACRRRTTWNGEARLARVSPEPSIAWTPEPWPRAKSSTTGPGGGRAGLAELGAEQLQQHLGEEVFE